MGIRERLVRRSGPSGDVRLVFEKHDNASTAPDSAFTPIEVASGDLLVMHGSLEHLSASNISPGRSRESLQVHIVDTGARWPPDNWLQYPPGMEFMRIPVDLESALSAGAAAE